MKTRLFVVIFAIFMMPTLCFGMIPTTDTPGFIQSINEGIETVMSKIENSKQVLALQEMMTKAGSAVATVSEKINEIKAVIEVEKKKIENWIKDAKEFIEERRIYLEIAMAVVSAGIEISEKGLDGYLKDNSGQLLGDAANAMGFDGSKVENFTNSTIDAIETGDFGSYGAGLLGDAATAAGFDGSKVENFTNSTIDAAKTGDFGSYGAGLLGGVAGSVGLDAGAVEGFTNGAIEAAQSGQGFGNMIGGVAGGVAGGIAGKVGIDVGQAQDMVNKSTGAVQNARQGAMADLVNMPAAVPSRQPISGVSEAVNSLNPVAPIENVNATKPIEFKAEVQPVSVMNKAELKAEAQPINAMNKAELRAEAQPVSAMNKTELKAGAQPVSAMNKAELKAGAQPINAMNKAELKAGAQPINAMNKAELKAGAQPINAMNKAELKVEKAVSATNLRNPSSKAEQQAKIEKAKEIATQAAKNATKRALPKNNTRPIPNKRLNQGLQLKENVATVKSLSVGSEKIPSLKAEPLNSIKPMDIDINKSIEPVKPQRTQFKSSFGYGKLQKIIPLSFASVTGGSNRTAEGVMVLPKHVAFLCELDAETAAEKGKMDECLKKLNAVSTSEVTEETSKAKIEEYTKDIHNGYVEYLAATFLEAMEIYNESLTFKNNVLDPFLTTPTNDVDNAWGVAKSMHEVLGGRINKLHHLWARVLGMKMYALYMTEQFVEEDEGGLLKGIKK